MRNRIFTALVTSSAILTLSACASIVEGSTDKVNIVTNPPSAASCTLSNSRGSYNTSGSGSVAVKKSKSDLNVSCSDPQTGAKGQSTVASDVEAWAFGNILLGGLIGLGVDWGTGAAYDYPASATIPMVAPVAPAAVEYQPFAPALNSQAPATTNFPASGAQIVAPTPASTPRYPAQ